MLFSTNHSVIKYIPSFKKVDLVKEKLKTVNLKAEELCVMFDTGGIETLVYCMFSKILQLQ